MRARRAARVRRGARVVPRRAVRVVPRRAARVVALVARVVARVVAGRATHVVARRGARVHARRPTGLARRGHALAAARRGGRVAHGAVPHPVLGRLLPVGGLRVDRYLDRLVSGHGRCEEVWLAGRRRERSHVGGLSGGRVGCIDVGGAGGVRGGVEGRRVRGGRVVHG